MKQKLKSILIPPLIVFIAISSVGVTSFFSSRTALNKDKNSEVTQSTQYIQDSVTERISIYEESLRSGVGLFNATDKVSKNMWNEFISSSSIFERYPGIQGIGYSYLINGDRKDIATQNLKNELGSPFAINPAGNRDLYSVVVYIEPENAHNMSTIGYDMLSESTRKQAMEWARDTGDIYLTKNLELYTEKSGYKELGFLMYAPQYGDNTNPQTPEQRQKNIKGYVYAVFKSQDLLEQIFKNNDNSNIEFRLYDAADQSTTLYESSGFRNKVEDAGIRHKDIIKLNGAVWGIETTYNDTDILPTNIVNRPRNILISGFIGGMLIAGITYLLLKTKSKQLIIEKERSISKAKDNLLSIASHQLRTPATGVKQYTGLLLQGFVGDLSARQTEILEKAYESNERQLKTINDILYLARLDSGRIILARKKTDINALVSSVVEELDAEFHGKNHTYNFNQSKPSAYADVDEHMARMIIENLITNSIKYTKSGGIIDIEVRKNKNMVSVSVKDNGVGISKDNINNKLFKQFSRVPNELSKTVTGSGIGLYLAKNLAELHGGSIEVKSEPNEGSEFTINFPKSVKNLTVKTK